VPTVNITPVALVVQAIHHGIGDVLIADLFQRFAHHDGVPSAIQRCHSLG
jgi:hypothetical protein